MDSTARWVVHKFGGTSVAGAERYRGVAARLAEEPEGPKAAVVSAMSKVTDAMLALVAAARRRESYLPALQAVLRRHREAAEALLPADEAARLGEVFSRDGADVADVLRGVWLGRSASELTEELVAGYGELWSAQLLCAHLRAEGRAAAWLDAREVLVVRPAESGPRVEWPESEARMRAWREANPCELLVVTGFIASTPEGVPTTLKRNGSDFSGSIFGALLDAAEVVIWTDVDGVLSADPRRVPEAVAVEAMSYDEACELAYFGAKVLHPRTMEPAVARGIPLRIRNSFNPSHRGSVIASPARLEGRARRPVAGFSTVDAISLINVEGTGMMGVPGVAQRLFGALREVGVSVVLISQASSEHSICFAVPEAQGERARDAAARAFAPELAGGDVQSVNLIAGQSVLAAVGDGMAHTPGVAATFFSALAKAGVSVRAIAQGSSERNISAVIDRADSTRALRAVHAGFVLSERVISVGIVGLGLVGKALLAQLEAQVPVLRERFGLELCVRAVSSSSRMLLGDPLTSLPGLAPRLAEEGAPLDLEAFAAHVRAPHLPHAVILDCSASDEVAQRYASWLDAGIHVVTPNKRAGAGPLARYRALRGAEARGRHFLYEATVGAGLPVIATLRDLVRTGDRVTRIEGVLSGTLSYVFNVWDGSTRFSEVVRQAKALGYTEPDPRDDLSGTDVARKLVILAREMGVEIELADVQIESLVPDCAKGAASAAEFLDRLADDDARMAERLAAAKAKGEALRYVGVVDAQGVARVSLLSYDRAHPFAGLGASDNIFAFTTARYAQRPLVVQGPGAGPEVTAGGVFGDLLRLAGWIAGRGL
ncbi:MAG: bifunctional aspartate kinase/homoserine dehydrogenase I [Polyangiales bacterium]